MSAIGIHVGYQTTAFAAPRGGGIDVLLNDYSSRQTPTMVSFGDKKRELGESAKLKVVTQFRNAISYFRNLVGRQYADADVQAELSRSYYKHQAQPDGSIGFVVNFRGEQRTFSPAQVLGMLLGHIRSCANKELQTKVTDCVISVPTFFTDRQRQEVIDASRIAGLNCLRLLNETTAVALAYGIYKQDLPAENETPRRVVFIDFGHSSLQVSCTEFVKGKLKVLASDHENLGGRDFDRKILEHMAEVFKKKTKLDLFSSPRATIRLEVECEKLKKQMSANATSIPINAECLMEERDFNSSMKREEFEELCSDLFGRINAVFDRFVKLLATLNITPADLYSVEIVGGAIRIPKFKVLVEQYFGKVPSTTLNAEEAVSRGCALMAAICSPNFRVRDFQVIDATPYAIDMGWNAVSGETTNHVELFAKFGAPTVKMFTFSRDSDFDLRAYYQKAEEVPGGHADLGNYHVEGVRPSADGKAQKIKVKVRLNANGIFAVESAQMVEKVTEAKEGAADDKKDAPSPAASEEQKAAGDSPAPMDTSADKAAEKSAEKEEKEEGEKGEKVKTKNVDLKVTSSKPHALSEAAVNALVETENELANFDREEKEKSDARNSLEEFIYDIRDRLGGEYEGFINEKDVEPYQNQLSTVQQWLDEDDSDHPKAEYLTRLSSLQITSNAIKHRVTEFAARPAAEETLQKTFVRIRKFLDSYAAGDEAYSHIDAAKVQKVKDELAKKEAWYTEKQREQAALAKHDDPVLLSSALTSAAGELDRACNPIINTPKPKVEPPPAAPAADAKPAADASAEKNTAAPEAEKKAATEMDLD